MEKASKSRSSGLKNAGWVCGAGWVFQGGLPGPELGGTFWLLSANSCSKRGQREQEGQPCSQVQTVDTGLLPSQSYRGGGDPTTVLGDLGAHTPVGRLPKLPRLPRSRSVNQGSVIW